jgi:hypothetical protein
MQRLAGSWVEFEWVEPSCRNFALGLAQGSTRCSRTSWPESAQDYEGEAEVQMGDGGFRPAYNLQLATAGSGDGGPRTMQTLQAKELYRARASLAELSNAHLKSRMGLGQFLVRGLQKVTCVALLGAVAANMLAHARALLS